MFKALKILLVITTASFTFFSCNDSSSTTTNCDLPFMVVKSMQDSLFIGEVFEAEIYLSDTRYLQMINPDGSKDIVYPLFEIEGKLIQNHLSNKMVVRDTVDSEIQFDEEPSYRGIECSILFPHPKLGAGSVKITRVIPYYVINR